jgi:hypothetical protein
MPVGKPSVLPSDTGGGGGGGEGSGGDTPADDLMASRSWGPLAAQNAESIGVSSTALAATCMIESGCQNINGMGTVSGAFQMTNATYLADIGQVVQQNPTLAASIDTSLGGKMDPANQAFASAQDLKNAALSLQSAGIANPTFLDTRGYYNFGAGPGREIAASSDSASLSSILAPYFTPAEMAANGVTPTMTVGQWRQSIVSKVGSAATQPILI